MNAGIGLLNIVQDEDREQQPLLVRQNDVVENRQRFQQNQEREALNIVRSPAFICLTLSVLLILMVVWWTFYITGWSTWLNHNDKPCDQPLASWLLTVLILPILLWCLSSKELAWLRFFVVLLTSIALIAGVYLFFQSETCADTNPDLYVFVKQYLIFLVIWHITWQLLWCVFVAVLIYGLVNGWFDEMLHGASPETINNIETVAFDPSLFAQEGVPDDNRPAPECCVCTELFDANRPIKRTPCQHFFHADCLENWLKRSKTCPLCRSDLEESTSAESSRVPKDQVINRGSLFTLQPGATLPPGNVPGPPEDEVPAASSTDPYRPMPSAHEEDGSDSKV